MRLIKLHLIPPFHFPFPFPFPLPICYLVEDAVLFAALSLVVEKLEQVLLEVEDGHLECLVQLLELRVDSGSSYTGDPDTRGRNLYMHMFLFRSNRNVVGYVLLEARDFLLAEKRVQTLSDLRLEVLLAGEEPALVAQGYRAERPVFCELDRHFLLLVNVCCGAY